MQPAGNWLQGCWTVTTAVDWPPDRNGCGKSPVIFVPPVVGYPGFGSRVALNVPTSAREWNSTVKVTGFVWTGGGLPVGGANTFTERQLANATANMTAIVHFNGLTFII